MDQQSPNKQSKILYLITKSNYGGAQKYVHELAVEAKNRGFDVAVAAGGTGERKADHGKLVELLEDSNIRFIPVTNFMRNMSLWTDVKAFFEIIKIIWKEKPDVLHVTSSKAGGIGAFVGRLLGIERIIFTSHGLTMDETWRPFWQRLLITWSTWMTIVLAHHTIMISTETYKRTKNLPLLNKRVSLVFNGIRPTNLLSKTEARAKLVPKLPQEAVTIGGIGELHKNKNWETLISTLPELPNTIHLMVIGEGESRTKLETLSQELQVSDRVHLLGFIDSAPDYVRMWDIFILPSKKEGLPYVLLEAGLAKLPVIASDLPGNRDIIIHEKTGLLVSSETELLQSSILNLIDNPAVKTSYGESLHESIHEKFSIDSMLDKTFSLYLVSK